MILGSGLSGGSLVVNDKLAASGQVGVVLSLPVNQAIPKGSQQLFIVTFNLASGLSAGAVIPLQVVNSPAPKSASDALGGDLAVNYLDGSITVATGYEGDVAPRPNGNNLVNAADVTVMGRTVAGLESNVSAPEFQRADCAPRSTTGNGVINAGDLTQVARYVAGLDAQTSVGGPTGAAVGPAGLSDAGQSTIAKKSSVGNRLIRIVNTSVTSGGTVIVPIQIAAKGNENALSFSLAFDPSKLAFTSMALGADAQNAVLVVNTNAAENGRIGVVVSLPVNQNLSAGALEILRVSFSAKDAMGIAPVSFTNSPAPESASDALGNDLEYQFVDGSVAIQSKQPLVFMNLHLTDTTLAATLSGVPAGATVVLQASSNLRDWTSVQTYTANGTSLSINRSVSPSSGGEFLRALVK